MNLGNGQAKDILDKYMKLNKLNQNQQIQQKTTCVVNTLKLALVTQLALLMSSTVLYSPLQIYEKHCRMLSDKGFDNTISGRVSRI